MHGAETRIRIYCRVEIPSRSFSFRQIQSLLECLYASIWFRKGLEKDPTFSCWILSRDEYIFHNQNWLQFQSNVLSYDALFSIFTTGRLSTQTLLIIVLMIILCSQPKIYCYWVLNIRLFLTHPEQYESLEAGETIGLLSPTVHSASKALSLNFLKRSVIFLASVMLGVENVSVGGTHSRVIQEMAMTGTINTMGDRKSVRVWV